MELEVIKKAGLSEAQAKVYLALIRHGELTPAKAAGLAGETRTNTYAILAKLEGAGLVPRGEGKTQSFVASHPSVLETIAEKRRRTATKNEQALKANMSAILDIFYAHSERPGVKTFTGYDGIKEIYQDVLRTGETVYLLRTRSDKKMFDFIMKYRTLMGKKGVKTVALIPDSKFGRESMVNGIDEATLMDRVMMPRDAYTADVSIMVYGKKVAFIHYGETEMSTIVTSEAIAEAMRQIIVMLREKYAER